MENKNLVEFLLYSYFGIENEDEMNDFEKTVKKCAHRAYLDLSRTVDYTYSSSELEKMTKKNAPQNDKDIANEFKYCKDNVIDKIDEIIFKAIKSYEKKQSFCCWHNGLCNEIKNTMNDALIKNNNVHIVKNKNFTYGQAQKWLNMTLKYCWLLRKLRNIDEVYLHVPVDSYIIEALWKEDFWNTKEHWENNDCRGTILRIKKINNEYNIGKYSGDKHKSWSAWEENEYINFQTALKKYLNDHISPIEWESKAWKEVAKNHATK